jgi:hypothetical protein
MKQRDILRDSSLLRGYGGSKGTRRKDRNDMAVLWILATFAFVALVLGTVGFGFVRMFFLAGAR